MMRRWIDKKKEKLTKGLQRALRQMKKSSLKRVCPCSLSIMYVTIMCMSVFTNIGLLLNRR